MFLKKDAATSAEGAVTAKSEGLGVVRGAQNGGLDHEVLECLEGRLMNRRPGPFGILLEQVVERHSIGAEALAELAVEVDGAKEAGELSLGGWSRHGSDGASSISGDEDATHAGDVAKSWSVVEGEVDVLGADVERLLSKCR